MEYVNNLEHTSNDTIKQFLFRLETTRRVER